MLGGGREGSSCQIWGDWGLRGGLGCFADVGLAQLSFALMMYGEVRDQARVPHSPVESWVFGSHRAGRRGQRGTLAPWAGGAGLRAAKGQMQRLWAW